MRCNLCKDEAFYKLEWSADVGEADCVESLLGLENVMIMPPFQMLSMTLCVASCSLL